MFTKMKRLQVIKDIKQEISYEETQQNEHILCAETVKVEQQQDSQTGHGCNKESSSPVKTSDHLDTDMSASEDSDQTPLDHLPEEHGGVGVMRMVYGDGGSQVMVMTTDEYSESAETDDDVDSVVSGRSAVAAGSGAPQHGIFAKNVESTQVGGHDQDCLFDEFNQQRTSADQQKCDVPASQSGEFGYNKILAEEKSNVYHVELPSCSDVKQRHNMPSGEGSHKCDVCGAGFLSKYHLNRHKITHTGEKPFKCDICGSGFMSDSSVKSHKRIHTGEKPYVCDVCGVGFTLGGHLKAHKRRHTGEKPYKCEYCSKSFSSGSVLKRHTRIHTGERPYKCEFCTLGFSCDSYLQRHRRKHTGERPYKCDVCLAEFMQSCNLKIHKRIHTGEKPFKCDVCGLELAHKSSLKSHQRLHTGEKPYVCDICGVKFTQSFGLKAHKVIHTGEKPYKCDVCGVQFTHRGSFRNHKKIHKRDHC